LSQDKVPLISFVQAGEFCDAEDPYSVGDAEEWITTHTRVTRGMYALRVKGNSMTSPSGLSVPEGMIIIVDPTASAENGDLVIAKDGASNKATFKKLSFDGDDIYLVPLNPDLKPKLITRELHICGVVV